MQNDLLVCSNGSNRDVVFIKSIVKIHLFVEIILYIIAFIRSLNEDSYLITVCRVFRVTISLQRVFARKICGV